MERSAPDNKVATDPSGAVAGSSARRWPRTPLKWTSPKANVTGWPSPVQVEASEDSLAWPTRPAPVEKSETPGVLGRYRPALAQIRGIRCVASIAGCAHDQEEGQNEDAEAAPVVTWRRRRRTLRDGATEALWQIPPRLVQSR